MSWIKDFLSKREDKEAIGDNQKQYRETFGVVDQYLIRYTDDKYIVFIDWEDDLDWVDKRDHNAVGWTNEEISRYNTYLARLDALQSSPATYLSHNIIMTFKKLLGSAYVMVMEKNFDQVDNVINSAKQYLDKRNREQSRYLYLFTSGILTAVAIALTIISHYHNWDVDIWIDTVTFGICGAFVSVWTRYGKIQYTGLSSRRLHVMEAISRSFVGALFAIVVVLLMKCHLILSDIEGSYAIYAYMLLSFIAGFSERFVPSLMEKIVNENVEENR